MSQRRKPFPGIRGVFDRKYPHSSYSQLSLRLRCPKLYEWVYRFGHKLKSRVMQFGKVMHELFYDLNRAAMAAPDGIGPEDLDKVMADPRLVGFEDFGWYITGCNILRRYAEGVNKERDLIVEVELPLVLTVDVRSKITGRRRRMKFTGVVDRLDKLKDGRYRFWDFKLGGGIVSPSDLLREFQPNSYNMHLRDHLNFHGKIVYTQYSMLSGKSSECVFDEGQAADTERHIRTKVAEQLGDIKFPARFNERCSDCPVELRRRCKEYASGAAWVDGKVLNGNLLQYANILSAIKAHMAHRDKALAIIKARIVNEGPEIIEDGWMASYSHLDGHTVESFEVAPRSVLRVSRDSGIRKRKT